MADDQKKTKPEQTERVVLKRIEIADLPDGGPAVESPGGVEAWLPILNEKAEHGPDGEMRIFKGSKSQCIEAYAGKNGEKHPGDYRAPALRSWKGGKGWVVPDKPKPESRLFE